MIKLILGVSILLLVSVQANAEIVDNGDWTTDTSSGLDWLDLDLTWGMSLAEASNSYSEWQLASASEYDGLFFTIFPNYTTPKLMTYDSNTNNDFDKHASQLERFFSLFGESPIDDPGNSRIQAFFLAENTGLDLMQLALIRDIERTVIDPHDHRGYTSDDTGGGAALFLVRATPLLVTIDIKPGSDPNSINLRSQGVIPVAILSTNTADGDAIDFDATQVDALTVKFGPSGAVESHDQGHVEDVDGDGDPDMVLHFKTQETGIVCGSKDATLVGETMGGTQFTGTDTVRTDGCNGSTKGKGALSWIFLLGLSVLGLWRQRG